MIYLFIKYFSLLLLVVILRAYTYLEYKTEHGIVFNCLVCCLTGLVAMPNKKYFISTTQLNGWVWCLLLGFWFYCNIFINR